MRYRLKTARLNLRPLSLADLDEFHRLCASGRFRQYLFDGEMIPRELAQSFIETSKGYFEKNGYGLWAVLPRDEIRLIGFCGFWFFHEPPELELLYGIAEEAWGRGFATEVAAAVMRYGFHTLGFERVQASSDAPNQASVRVMQKLGMGFLKRKTLNGLDTIFYSITREEFTQLIAKTLTPNHKANLPLWNKDCSH